MLVAVLKGVSSHRVTVSISSPLLRRSMRWKLLMLLPLATQQRNIIVNSFLVVFPVCLSAPSSVWLFHPTGRPSRTMHLTSAIIAHCTECSEHKCMYFLG